MALMSFGRGLLAAASCLVGCAQAHPGIVTFDGYVDRLCDESPALGGSGHFGGGYADLCVFDRDPTLQRLRAALADGRLDFDPAAAAACEAEGRYVVFEDIWTTDETCPEAFVPLTPLGGACDSSFECIDGFCERDDYGRSRPSYVAGGCGVCVPLHEVGEPCDGHGWVGQNIECAPGLVCTHYDGGVCIAPPRSGGRCGLFADCPEGESCTNERDGTCIPDALPALGAACVPGRGCSSELLCMETCPTGEPCAWGTTCGDGSACGSVGVCVAPVMDDAPCGERAPCVTSGACIDGICRPSELGEPCAEVGCREGTYCDYRDDGTSRCRAAETVGVGEACDWLAACERGLACDAGRCVRVRRIGESCTDALDACAAGGDCRGGVCARASPLGGPCEDECEEGMCVMGTCVTPPAGTACDLGGPTCGELACSSGDGTTNTCRPAAADCNLLRSCRTGEFCGEVFVECQPICIVGR